MASPEERPPIDWSPFNRHALAAVVLSVLFVFVFSWAEGRPWTRERIPDLFATAIMAGPAGFGLALVRMFLSELLGPQQRDETSDPVARSDRRKKRAVLWFAVIVMLPACALMLLCAVSIGTGHGEWATWIPVRVRGR